MKTLPSMHPESSSWEWRSSLTFRLREKQSCESGQGLFMEQLQVQVRQSDPPNTHYPGSPNGTITAIHHVAISISPVCKSLGQGRQSFWFTYHQRRDSGMRRAHQHLHLADTITNRNSSRTLCPILSSWPPESPVYRCLAQTKYSTTSPRRISCTYLSPSSVQRCRIASESLTGMIA